MGSYGLDPFAGQTNGAGCIRLITLTAKSTQALPTDRSEGRTYPGYNLPYVNDENPSLSSAV